MKTLVKIKGEQAWFDLIAGITKLEMMKKALAYIPKCKKCQRLFGEIVRCAYAED